MKHSANREISPIARSVTPNSSAPASDVIAPPSNPATTVRRPTGANSNSSGLHSVGIGALLESREVVLAKQLSLIRGAPVLQLCEISGLAARPEGFMRRRDLISLVGGAAAWPLAVR